MDVKLDDTDRHLLSLLQANAREPGANLARKLQIARTTVAARIARLERACALRRAAAGSRSAGWPSR